MFSHDVFHFSLRQHLQQLSSSLKFWTSDLNLRSRIMSGSEPGGPTEVTPIFWQPNFSISTDLYHRKRILYISSWGPYIFCYQTRRLVWRRRWQDLLVSFPNIFVDQRHARPHLCPRTLAGIIQRFTLYLASLVLFDLYFVRRWCFENGLVFFSVRGGGLLAAR